MEDVAENQTNEQYFEIQVFIVRFDNALPPLAKHMEAYHQVSSVFGILQQLK